MQRVALHPLDQFRAFQALRNKGLGDEEIATRFFVTTAVVEQRLRLAGVSDKLIEIYADDGMSLEQLMAFTVSGDHARQEQVWEAIHHPYNKEPYFIRRQLTDGAVRASDPRARFVGVKAYEAADGVIMRDLFQHDDGGWLQDPALLERLAIAKLQDAAEILRAEGWKWIAVATDFPYGHTAGLRRLTGEAIPLTDDENAGAAALKDEYDALEAQYADADELPDEIGQRLAEIETALAAFDERPLRYDPADIAQAGIFVSIGPDGVLRVERGFVRPEDETPPASGGDVAPANHGTIQRTTITIGGTSSAAELDALEDDEAIRPLSDWLVMELTAHRTLALRDAVANAPDIAFQAVLHTLCLSAFYHYASSSCLEITAKQATFTAQASGLAETDSAKAIEARHAQWAKLLPQQSTELWDTVAGMDHDRQAALFAHCASLTINVIKDSWSRSPGALAHGEQLADTVSLDMVAAGWAPSVDNYLGRVPKARILEAVREAKGERSVMLIASLKKTDMAREAERLLAGAGAGWLPKPLRATNVELSPSKPLRSKICRIFWFSTPTRHRPKPTTNAHRC